MATRYNPTPLPVKLDITKTDTGKQLRASTSRDSVSNPSHHSRDTRMQDEMNRMCIQVVKGSLEDFLERFREEAVSPSSDACFERWVRYFHSEYDDSWYSKNHSRLVKSFRPIWDEHFGKKPTKLSSAEDLLDLGPSSTDPPRRVEFPDLLG